MLFYPKEAIIMIVITIATKGTSQHAPVFRRGAVDLKLRDQVSCQSLNQN